MAQAVTLNQTKKQLLEARAGIGTISHITQMAFGTGGVNSSGQVIDPDPTQTGLSEEIYRKNIDEYQVISDTQIRYSCTLDSSELPGKAISEIGLVDAEGMVLCVKTFGSKVKDDGTQMLFYMDDKF